MNIYEKPGYVTVSFVKSPKHILFDWTKLSVKLADLKDLHMKALDAAKEHGVLTMIAETSKITDVLSPDCIDWFGTEHVPRLATAGIKRIITVVPKTALGRLTTKSWQGAVQGIEIHEVATLEEANKLII